MLGLLDPGYSQMRDHISELGAQHAPFASVMHFVGTVLVGVLLSSFSVALYCASNTGSTRRGGEGVPRTHADFKPSGLRGGPSPSAHQHCLLASDPVTNNPWLPLRNHLALQCSRLRVA